MHRFVLEEYQDILEKAKEQSSYLNGLMSNVEGLKESVRKEIKAKLDEIQHFTEIYERELAPKIVNAV